MTTFNAYTDVLHGVAGPVLRMDRPENATLADLIGLVPVEEALRPHFRVKLNGEMIEPRLYRRIRPKDGAYITIYLPVHGGKDGGKLLSSIAAIALIGASLFVGAFGVPFLGSAFAAGSIGANIVAGGLAIGASLLLQGLQPSINGPDSQPSKEVGIASAQNAFEPGAYLQRVIGIRKVAPKMIMPPFTEVDGDDQIVTAAYGLAGAHRIDQIRVGTAEIEGAADIQYEVREGFADDEPVTLVTDTRIEATLNIKLSQFRMASSNENTNIVDTSISPYSPQWHRAETKLAPDMVRLFLTFDQGLIYLADNGAAPAITALRLRIRRKGSGSWYNLPEFVARGEKQNGALRLFIDFEWRAPADMPGSVTAFSTNYGGFSWMYKLVESLAGDSVYWLSHNYFASNKVDWISKQQLKVYLNTDTFPQDGAYEIEVTRGFSAQQSSFTATSASVHRLAANGITLYDFWGTAIDGSDTKVPDTQTRFVDGLIAPSIQSIWDEPPFDFATQPTAVIVVRARNRSLDQLSCRAAGYCADWDGAAWVEPVPGGPVTSNPASWYREVLSGQHNAEPVPPSLLSLPEIQAWHDWCASRELEVNAVIEREPVVSVISVIAQAGFARPSYGAPYRAVMDRRRDAPVGMVTQRNASGFSFEKPFLRLSHALRVTFTDADNDYEVREIVVYTDGYNADGSGGLIEATRFDAVNYPGIVYEDKVIARAKRDMRTAKYRTRMISFTMDIEHLEFTMGDLVMLETDILGQIGGRGRVKDVIYDGAGDIAGLRLDEEAAFPPYRYIEREDGSLLLREDGSPFLREGDYTRGATLRLADGTLLTSQIEEDDSDRTVLTFVTPFEMPTEGGDDLIGAGTLVATGSLTRVAREVLAWDITPGADLTANITAIDYAADEIYGGSGFSSGFSSGFGGGFY